MSDVAKRAGVSTATVSNVLSARKPVDPALVARVRAAAAELEYQIDRAASRLRSGKTTVIGIVVPALENSFFTSLIAAVERAAQPEGYDLLVASANENEAVERARLSALLSWRPAGVVIVPCTDAFNNRDLLTTAGVPYVVLDRLPADIDTDIVSVDNVAAGRDAAQHLLALGHRDIWVVASSLALANIAARRQGISSTYEAAGLSVGRTLQVGTSFERIAETLEREFAEVGRPSAVIALTNFTTMGVLSALSKNHIRVPDEISLVGFDDYAWMSASSPTITAIRQPVNALGEAAWSRLRQRLGGDRPEPDHLRLTCSLQVRQSTRKVDTKVAPG